MTLYKYCANGNDFLLFHTLFTQGDYSELARKVCDRHSGIGADGLVVLLPFSDDRIAYQWDFYNADGSRANMCGNASRCAAHYAYNLGLAPRDHSFITHSSMQAQVIKVRVKGDIVSSNLGLYRNLFALESLPSDAAQKVDSSVPREVAASLLNAAKWHYIDTGVPHLVCFVQDLALVRESGAATKVFMQELRKSFDANVNLAYAASGDEIYLATYERGVEDITLACGTGMAATLLVGYKVYGLESSASLIPPSGDRLKLWCEPFAKKDSACGLESQSSSESHKSHREQVALESTFENNAQKVPKVDSSKQAQSLNRSQAAGFADDFVGCQGGGEGIYLSGNEQAPAADSHKNTAKPTPEQKVDSSSKLPTLAHINELESKAYSGDMEVFLEGKVRCVAVCQTCYD